MKFKDILGYYEYVFILISCSIFVFGVTQIYENFTIPVAIASLVFLFGSWLIRHREIEFPKGFLYYVLFLVIFVVHTQIFGGKNIFGLLFLSGGLYWLAVYNLRQLIAKYFSNYLLFLGVLMLGVHFGSIFYGITSSSQNNLFLPLSINSFHNHLGDIWAIITVAILYKMFQKYRMWHVLFLITGVIFIALSFSRSAVLSLVVGLAYIYSKYKNAKYVKYIFISILLVASMLFVYSSSFKTTLFSRPYIVESVNAFIKFPLGIGVGNFGRISHESSYAHNIVFEITTGMGIFSLFFGIWLLIVSKTLIKNRINVLYMALFLAITTNFLFDTTYVIPTMIWLWFSTLGLALE